MQVWRVALAGVALGTLPVSARAQAGAAGDGAAVFSDHCATCHSGAPETRAPGPDALSPRAPEAIVEALVNGAMRTQGSRLSGPERRAVAEFLTGRAVGGDVTGAMLGRCSARAPFSLAEANGGGWSGWSPGATNTRHQAAARAGLTADDLPRLTLLWAFGFPDASAAWAQPAVVGGRVFVGSQNGTVYALDARTGCIYWTFSAGGGVRTAVSVGPYGENGRALVYFGDTAGQAYAVDAETGTSVWVTEVDTHPLTRMTGAPTLYDGRLYVGVSSYEEAQGANPEYACCTFRGSVSALDAATGEIVWKTYTIPEEPRPRGTSSAGVTLWGPAGAAVWSAPTIDVDRRAVYVATGNMYSGPAEPSSDAIIAFDLDTGVLRWQRQVTPGDIYVSGCRGAGNPNCPEKNGPDFDFGSAPILARRPDGRTILVAGQKSGMAFAFDPDRDGEVLWQYRAGQGGVLGGIEWGAAADAGRAYFAVSDILTRSPGGLHAVELATGRPAWVAPPDTPLCGGGRGCSAAQSSAVTLIEGALLSGSVDGGLRAYSTADGQVLWEYDTNRDFETVNGVQANGASMIGPGPAVADGMLLVGSGYGAFGGRAGNVLLAFGVEGNQ